jgi:hypothetical protein
LGSIAREKILNFLLLALALPAPTTGLNLIQQLEAAPLTEIYFGGKGH